MPLPALLAAALPAIGAGVSSFLGQTSANRQNLQIAREQMGFQERMSGTAYQRATDDMERAGINPALAYMQGGASSPGGAQTTVQDAIGPAVSSAMHGLKLRKELELMDAQKAKIATETDGVAWDNQLKSAVGPDKLDPRDFGPGGVPFPRLMASTQHRFAQIAALRAQAAAAGAGRRLDEAALPGALVTGSKWAQYIRMITGSARDVGGVAVSRGKGRPVGRPITINNNSSPRNR